MKLDKLIDLFDEKAIAAGKVAFTIHAPKSGKWNFWAEEGEKSPKVKLKKSIMKIKELSELDIDGFQETALEPWGENEEGIRVRITF